MTEATGNFTGLRWARYRVLFQASAFFLSANLLVRAGLAWFEGGLGDGGGVLAWLQVFLVGMLYDAAALTWILIPFSLLALACSAGRWGRRIHGVLASGLFAALIATVVFESASEFVFWNEFASRFNFIAVDYLVFTREVVGNIRESYPLPLMLAAVVLVTLGILALLARRVWWAASGPAPGLFVRSVLFVASLALPALTFFALGEQPHRWLDGAAARELASNGTYSLFRAFRNNELSYPKYYLTLDSERVSTLLNEELREADGGSVDSQGLGGHGVSQGEGIARRVCADGAPLRRNVVLVSIESLGSDYVDAFDGQRGLTPNLDALARESVIFTNVYATGLRTVRGLEALTLSLPPTPGRAVPMRGHNKNLQSLGQVFRDQGYEALYLYGGYSWFDNMNDFFGGNGYTVIDRTAIPDEEISHETIWGVADEDLYRLALRELDKRASEGRPFFAHIMTTSNHRPYTYPENRVSIPPHTGRDGAVQYTDWAIGQFMAEVRKRSWFDDTVFVFVADHTSHGRGRTDLPPENYRIPLIIHAPGLLKPGKVESVASQIDVGPTLLALLNMEYESRFFGQDILHQAELHPRAFMANYLTIGYLEDGRVVELGPRRMVRVVDAEDGHELAPDAPGLAHLVDEAVAHFQAAAAYIENHAGAVAADRNPPDPDSSSAACRIARELTDQAAVSPM